jgi:membrane-associated phospholipid phosphatase
MLLVPLVVLPLLAWLVVGSIVWRWPAADPASPKAARRATETVQRAIVEEHGARRFITRRTDPSVATGLFLTVALAVTFVGALAIGVLALLVRSDSGVVSFDHHISQWSDGHNTALAHDVLQGVTQLGSTMVVVVAAIVLAIVEMIRRPSRWLVPFLLVVLVGQNVLTNSIKDLLERVRPTLNPSAHLLGPSFPSGHSATAAAFWAAAALIVGRGRGRYAHAVLAATAVSIAVAVASSRVLLDVHWFSDVLGGVALGWAWFALSSIAFGGRLLRFGAPVEAAERVVAGAPSASPSPRPRGSRSSRGPSWQA